MLNTPSELSEVTDETSEADIFDTTDELEESTTGEAEESETLAEDESEEEIFLIGEKEYTASQLEDLEKGGMLQSDYTRKRQAESAEFKTKMSEIDSLVEQADLLESFLDEDEKEVEWDDLMKSEERAIEAKFKTRRKQIADLRKNAGKVTSKVSQETLTETNQAVSSHFSEWQGKNGEKNQKADLDSALVYAKSIGYTDAAINKLSRPEDFIAIIEAAKYNAIKNAKPKAKRTTPKTVAQKNSAKGKTKSVSELFYGT
jgi:hypothetical protein